MTLVGVGFRRELAPWMDSHPDAVGCLEITAEHFYDGGLDHLRDLREWHPTFVHGLGLSLGTPGPLDKRALAQFDEVVQAADPLWISEHVAFTRTDEVDLGHLNPILPSRESLEVLSAHARELADYCGKPLILENITSHLRLEGELGETEFLNRLCDGADCGILLDVTNLYINSRNHGFDASKWLHELDPARIVQLHIVGYGQENGRWIDSHAEPIQEELFALLGEVLAYAPVRAVIIERDEHFSAPDALADELSRIRRLAHGP
jgi:hypothetical protein